MSFNLLSKPDQYYAATRTDMLRFIRGKPQRILEIGCGEGNFAQNFPGLEYLGVEPNTQMAARATARGTPVLTGLYENVSKQIPNGHFDLIVCNDVIEHMLDPAGFLRNVRNKLTPDGQLIASIPNLRYAPLLFDLLFHADFEYTQSGILDYTHLHLFTPKSFARLAERCGWRIELSEPLSTMPFKPIKNLILKLLERKTHDLRNIQFAVRLTPIQQF